MPDTLRTVILAGRSSSLIGTVSVSAMPASSLAASSLSESSGKRPCVAQAYTSVAPASLSAAAPVMSVLPVTMRSSLKIATFPRTSPITSVTTATSCAGRFLFMIAKSASSI
jgi:hypothetical protein